MTNESKLEIFVHARVSLLKVMLDPDGHIASNEVICPCLLISLLVRCLVDLGLMVGETSLSENFIAVRGVVVLPVIYLTLIHYCVLREDGI